MDLLGISTQQARRRLLAVIREVSVFRGEFVLASGKTSDTYFDLRLTTTHPEGAALAARLFLEEFNGRSIEAVGGPTLGADPIVGAVVAVSALQGTPLPGFIVRKEVKGHGGGRRIEGHLEKGARVAVVDDTVTGGGSILTAVDAVREAGGVVDALYTIVDRDEGGRERAAGVGLELRALFTADEVLDGA